MLTTQTVDLRHEVNELAVQPISLDSHIFRETNNQLAVSQEGFLKVKSEQVEKEKFERNCLECLMGTRDGIIYVYDPLLVMKGKVMSYNDSGLPFYK